LCITVQAICYKEQKMQKIIPVFLCLVLLVTVSLFATSCGLPQAAFTVSVINGAAPLNVTFTNTTQGVGQDSKVVFDWDFGDGGSMTATKISDTISHKYTKAGTFTVKITAYNPEDPKTNTFITATVTVTHGDLTTLDITPETVELKIGETKKFSSAAFDDFANPVTEANLTWKDGDAGTVTTDGSFTAGKKAGVFNAGVILTGEAGGVKLENSPKVTILPDPLDKITIQTLEIAAGDAKSLVIDSVDQYGNRIEGLEATWSIVDGRAGTVTASGIFTASHRAATYNTAVRVTIKQGNKTTEATGTIIIKAGSLSQVGIAPSNISIGKGMTQQYVAVGADKYGNRLKNVTFSWTCDKAAGSISSSGLFKASNNANSYTNGVTVTASAGGSVIKQNSYLVIEEERILYDSDKADTSTTKTARSFRQYTMNIDGTDIKDNALTAEEWLEYGIRGTLDGRRLVYIDDVYDTNGDLASSSIWVSNTDGSWPVKINTGMCVGSASLSPDGTKIVYTSRALSSTNYKDWEIWVVEADGSNARNLTKNAIYDAYPEWTPDGSQILYVSTKFSNSEWACKVCSMNIDGSGARQISNDLGVEYRPKCSPDGKYIAVEVSDVNQASFRIAYMKIDGSNFTYVTGADYNARFPYWSPDGTKIAFCSDKTDNQWDVFRINRDGTELYRLTDSTARDMSPTWLMPKKGVEVNETSITVKEDFNEINLTAQQISNSISAAVVRIEVKIGIETGSGTGFIIKSDGLIVTANHVIADAQSITVYTTDGSKYEGRVLARDTTHDLALVKIDSTGFSILEFDINSGVQNGQPVVVLGYPLGNKTISLTSGLVSSTQFDDGRNTLWIQTDSAINPGNSGGPMLNMQGRIVGIVTAKIFGLGIEGIGYAISNNTMNLYLHLLLQQAGISLD
jgi:Tol biopolymer transport system component/PKD repeat protein